MQVVDVNWGVQPRKTPPKRRTWQVFGAAVLTGVVLVSLGMLLAASRWSNVTKETKTPAREAHRREPSTRSRLGAALKKYQLHRRNAFSHTLMCDELVLPFDSSSGGGLVFDKVDGVRGARRMPRLLMNNKSISSRVEEDDYDFFQICVQLEQSFRFTVDVTHNSGNPDLYISFSQPWPYVGNSDIISANINREHINVSTTAEIVQEAMRVPGEKPSERYAVPSVIFLSVFGRETSTYTITATLTPEFSKFA